MKDINYVEVSQAVTPDGRRRVRLALHEIYPDETHCNGNGITYLEEYTKANAASVINMPICARFLDEDKDIPFDHGLTGHEDFMPLFEDSVQVGSADGWSIEDIVIDGETRKVLVAEGHMNQQRYPKFVDWIEKRQLAGEKVYGSVEFVGTKENGQILYKDGKTHKDKYRVPVSYCYSGFCIITVKPSDSSAILIELNQLDVKKEDYKMEINENILSAFTSDITSAVVDVLDKNAQKEEKIAELSSDISKKKALIAELEARCKDFEENMSLKEALLEEKEKQLSELLDELNECKQREQINELDAALIPYSEEQRNFAKEDIEKFKASPLQSGVKIDDIITKIDAASYRKLKEKSLAETNSAQSREDLSGVFAACLFDSTDDLTDLFE